MKAVEQCPGHGRKNNTKNSLENIVVEKLEKGRHIYLTFSKKRTLQ